MKFPPSTNKDGMSSTEEKPIVKIVEEKEEQVNIDENSLEDQVKPILHNNEPVITTGHDVSRFVVDVRDDGDTALTFRSMFLGTIFAGMGATLSQVNNFVFQVTYCDTKHFC